MTIFFFKLLLLCFFFFFFSSRRRHTRFDCDWSSDVCSSDLSQAKELSSPETILLKDYRPKSIYKIPVTQIDRAKHPIIDMHSHPYAKTPQQIEEWLKNMDEVGIQKTMILTMTTGAEFDEIYRKYSKYPDRFEVWCGLDLSGYDKPGFGAPAVKELERCHQIG